MDKKRKITLGVATLAVALGAGHLVQSGKHLTTATDVAEATVAEPTGITPLAASAQPDTITPAPGDKAPTPAAVVAQVATPAPAAMQPAAPVPVSLTTDKTPSAAPKPAVQADACQATLDVVPGANGMLDLTLLSPCEPGSRVVLRHGGLAVTGKTSSGGALFTALPALDSAGEVSAMFPDGTIARGAAPVDLTGMRRFAIQWMADDRFALNAYQGGAAYGSPGHIHAGAAGKPDSATGWLMPLGDATVTLGRHRSNTVAIGDTAVSRQHGLIRREGGGWRLIEMLQLSFDAFSSREPVPTSLENAPTATGYAPDPAVRGRSGCRDRSAERPRVRDPRSR